MSEPNTTEVIVDGVRSPVMTSGPQDSSTAVVFVHGNPGSSHDFRGLVAAVGPLARCVALDMPGFGRADKPRDFPQTAVGHADHLDGALAQLGIDRVHLVLHDFGGLWGLAWAAGHVDRVASVTLIDTGILLEHRWHWPARMWLTRGLGELSMRLSTTPAFKAVIQYGYAFKPAPVPLPADFLAHMAADFDAGTRDSVLRLYRDSRHAGDASALMAYALRQFDFPALVIWGGRDYYLPVKHAREQLEAFPGARLVILDDAGHWPMITHPQQTEAAVVDFLRDVISGEAESAASDRTKRNLLRPMRIRAQRAPS